jgi:hypothetical protein
MTRRTAQRIVKSTPRYLVLLVRAYRMAPQETDHGLAANAIGNVWHELQPDHIERGKLIDALITLAPNAACTD